MGELRKQEHFGSQTALPTSSEGSRGCRWGLGVSVGVQRRCKGGWAGQAITIGDPREWECLGAHPALLTLLEGHGGVGDGDWRWVQCEGAPTSL
jgi:hypothetical protein